MSLTPAHLDGIRDRVEHVTVGYWTDLSAAAAASDRAALLAEVDRLTAERPDLYNTGWRDGHRAAHFTITTREELNALPYECVVRDYVTAVFEKWDPKTHGRDHWRQVGADDKCSVNDIVLPATVLYTPEP